MLLFNSNPILHTIPLHVAESVFSIFYRRYCIWPFACLRPGKTDVNLVVWAIFGVLALVIDWLNLDLDFFFYFGVYCYFGFIAVLAESEARFACASIADVNAISRPETK